MTTRKVLAKSPNSSLIVPPDIPGTLTKPSCNIVLNTKITKNDLIETAIYDLEEKLLNKKEELNNLLSNLRKEVEHIEDELESEKDNLTNNYKENKMSNLVTQLQQYSRDTLIVKTKISDISYSNTLPKVILRVAICIITDKFSGINRDLGLSKEIHINCPKKILSLKKNIENIRIKIEQKNKELCTISSKIEKLPQIKKKINAELIRAMLGGNFNQSDEIINKLQKIVVSKLEDTLNF